MPFICRKYLALTRLSNLSIRIETGRFERPRIDENLRIFQACNDGTSVENGNHVIFQCSVYSDLRTIWLSKIKVPEDFSELLSADKLKIVLNSPDNVKVTAQFILDACNLRSKIVRNTATIDFWLIFTPIQLQGTTWPTDSIWPMDWSVRSTNEEEVQWQGRFKICWYICTFVMHVLWIEL